jgi:hypothetical protein
MTSKPNLTSIPILGAPIGSISLKVHTLTCENQTSPKLEYC